MIRDAVPGATPGVGDVHGPSWEEVADALDGLVGDGTLSSKQADAVHDRLGSPPDLRHGDGEVAGDVGGDAGGGAGDASGGAGDAGGGAGEDRAALQADGDAGELSWAAQFVRISGVLLVVLLSVQFVDLNIVNDPPTVDGVFLVQRWESPVLQLLDWLVIVLGTVHGAIGVRWIIHRRISSPSGQLALEGLIYGLLATLAALASYVVLAYG